MTNDAQDRPRLRRSASFFGIHFDFHATEDSPPIGARTTREALEAIIHLVRPDYIQCDCKGHPGISSYPTRVGYHAPKFIGDPLRLWREVTAEHGVALYMHYSGVWDTAALKHHPEWAQVEGDGKASTDITSVFSPYVDNLLIPQLKELCDEYAVDGVWIDGDCWAIRPDYSAASVAAFRELYAVDAMPREPGDPYYFEFMQFSREAFRTYLKHYVTTLHEHNRDFQIASNWMYSSFAPEPVMADVDFLSGDLTLTNAVTAARLEARCLSQQGKPWDLMAWGFGGHFNPAGESYFSTKPARQLQQEAAIVISQGGGFQAYFTQKADGAINQSQLPIMREVGRFCRTRQPFCQHTQPVPQIALLYPSSALYRQSRVLFGLTDDVKPMRGVLQCLLENQYSVSIEFEHTLSTKLADYPLVVLPEWPYLTSETRDQLLAYVAGGGNLLLVGPQSAALFADELNISLAGELQTVTRWLHHGDNLGVLKTSVQTFQAGEQVQTFGTLYTEMDSTGSSETAAFITPYRQGKIAATSFQFGLPYLQATTTVTRDFIGALVQQLFPDPLVEVTGSYLVDVVLNRLHDDLHIHLINTSGPHANAEVYTFDEIPPPGPLTVMIRCSTAPSAIIQEPAGISLPFSWQDGRASLTIPRLELYDILRVVSKE